MSGILLFAACTPLPEGLLATPPGAGPLVAVDWDAEPLPELPFPNDLATRLDPTSPTGLRINLPLDADIAQEGDIRETLNGLSGFGVFAPITVSFEAPLDVQNIVDRHPDDLWAPAHFADDVVLLIDVDPESPELGRVVPVDLGSGRFPQDLTEAGALLPNDPRASAVSLLFESVEEDLDGDGALDPGEDTDGDGILDHPNVWPPGGDPRLDQLSFYDLQARRLFVRPIVPLREGTRYAVVLTSDLLGDDGEPVRSPWAWVNHTAQTIALEPVIEAMDGIGRPLEDIAFAWTFTTGEITTELWELAEGVRGSGPYAHLAAQFPPVLTEGHELHAGPVPDPMSLPVEKILGPLLALGYFPPESSEILAEGYAAFTREIVGGAFLSPDLLVDGDGDGSDADEHIRANPVTGEVAVGSRRLVFTCVVPRAGDGIEPPWPVAIHAHGYGSTRVEFLGFAWALARHGIASCGIDAPGHGLGLGETEKELVGDLLDITGTEPTWWHLLDDRQRDLDNDGTLDPAGDMFSADPFHTRDMVRQGVVDWAQFIRVIQACGSSTMERTTPSEGGPIRTGERVVSCDWDNDGVADLGGPDTKFYLEGISQGGIMSALSIAVNEAETAVLTVPGGGLADVGGRTDINAVQASMIGRALSPAFVGVPSGLGLDLQQVVISVDDDVSHSIGSVPTVPAGGTAIVRNLDLGVEVTAAIPADGRFFVPIKANALEPPEKAVLAGISEVGGRYEVPENAGLGDRLELELLDADGQQVARIETFAADVLHEGVTYPAGSPLVALSWGLGLRRGSADLQQTIQALAIGVEGGDPIVYARRWQEEPFEQEKNVLIHLTAGDTTVPEATGIALARADGLVEYQAIDERYGTTVDRWLIDRGVVRGLEEFGPWRDAYGSPILFDPDDLDDGTDGTGAPSDAPLRASRDTASGVHGLRVLYVEPTGTHAYILPNENAAFDWALFGVQQMSEFLSSDGRNLTDDPCLATRDCPFLRPFPESP